MSLFPSGSEELRAISCDTGFAKVSCGYGSGLVIQIIKGQYGKSLTHGECPNKYSGDNCGGVDIHEKLAKR